VSRVVVLAGRGQAVSLMAAAQGTRLEAYIIMSLLAGLRTRRRGRCAGITSWPGLIGTGSQSLRLGSITSRWRGSYGELTGLGVTRRRRSRGGRYRWRVGVWRRCGSIGYGRRRTGSRRGRCGRITTLFRVDRRDAAG
jgi:hypothetical protein